RIPCRLAALSRNPSTVEVTMQSPAADLSASVPRAGGSRPMSGDLIRVMRVDAHAVVRAGLKAVLGTAKDIDVVGEARNGKEAVALAERLRPDVVVMDLSMDEMDGTTATRNMAARGETPKG